MGIKSSFDIRPTLKIANSKSPVSKAQINVAVVEDDPQQRTNVVQLLNSRPEFNCIAQFGSPTEAVRALPHVAADVVLMDIRMSGKSGIECIRELKPQMPHTQFMVLTVFQEDAQIFEAIKAGATGYMIKKDFGQPLLQGIQDLHSGGSPMSCQIARKVLAAFRESLTTKSAPDDSPLTPAERQVLNCLSRGLLYKEIADELHIALSTVRTHVHHIYGKLQAHTRTEAVLKGMVPGAVR